MRRWIRVGSAVMGMVSVLAVSAVAQTNIKTDEKLKQPIVLDFKDTPISTALQVLFNGTGMNYVIENTVSGNVKNMHIEVPFEQALKALLKSVDPPLVYKKDPGSDVYIISVKKPEPPQDLTPVIDTTPIVDDVASSEDTIIEKISLNFLDAYEVKALIEGQDSRGGNGAGGFGNNSGFGGGFGNSSFGGGFGGGGFGGGFGNNSSFGGGFGNNSSWGNNNNNSSWGNRSGGFGGNNGGFNRGW